MIASGPPAPGPSIAVIGGGVTGLAAAETLRREGNASAVIYERDPALGGLSSGTQIGGLPCDRFYHVVLPSDRETRAWIEDLGLSDRLTWSAAGSGFFGRSRLVPLTGSADFLRFPFLSLPQKMRLGLGLLRAARITDPSGPAAVPARLWLERLFGAAVTKRIWMPLLRSKLGDAAPRASAAFIWASIRRLMSARHGAAGRESWGGLRGGVRGLIAAAETRLRGEGIAVRTACPVRSLESLADGRVALVSEAGRKIYDAVLLTIPGPQAARLLPAGAPGARFWSGVEYLGVEAVLVLLKRRLSPYYIINLLDESLPFTGIIEATNVLPPEEFAGRHLVYLPKYGPPAENRAGDEETKAAFLAGLKVVFPDLRDGDLLDVRLERAAQVQPLLPPGPVDPFPEEARRPMPGVLVANTALITRSPNNLDAGLRLGREAARSVLAGMGRVEGKP
jgi:protoporphyrinogen oxidase